MGRLTRCLIAGGQTDTLPGVRVSDAYLRTSDRKCEWGSAPRLVEWRSCTSIESVSTSTKSGAPKDQVGIINTALTYLSSSERAV